MGDVEEGIYESFNKLRVIFIFTIYIRKDSVVSKSFFLCLFLSTLLPPLLPPLYFFLPPSFGGGSREI